jgi:putative transposase
VEKIVPLLDTLSGSHGVGPVCHELNIASSTYYRHCKYRQHPEKRSQRYRRDEQLKREIQRVYDENYSVYGLRKVWRQLQRVARYTVARLMKEMGLLECAGARRSALPSAVSLKPHMTG